MLIVCLGCVACVMAEVEQLIFSSVKSQKKAKKENNGIIDSPVDALLCSQLFCVYCCRILTAPKIRFLFVLFAAIDFECL